MNTLFVESEAKLFCLLIIGFLYFFRKKNFQSQGKRYSCMYLFSACGVLFSMAEVVAVNEGLKNIFSALCICCYIISAFFCCKSAFNAENTHGTTAKSITALFVCLLFGVFAFYSYKHNSNAAVLVLVFAIITVYVREQRDKIRIDNLTNLYNRYGMDAELQEQLRQYEHEHSDSFYIIACDLDNFKYINDTWGHLEGDRALILIANALSRVVKTFHSNVFRIGGDEFIIIADTIKEGIDEEIINAIKNELDKIEFRDDFDIKMSIGVSLYDGKTSIDELLNNADKKLYEAKKSKPRAI